MSRTTNYFKVLLANGIINFDDPAGGGDEFRIILMQPGFVFDRASHVTYGDVSPNEIAGGTGYSVGGNLLVHHDLIQDDVLNAAIKSWNNAQWTAAGGNIVAGSAIIYDETVAAPVNNPIVGVINFAGTLTTQDGGTFTIANIAIAIRDRQA